MPRRRSHGSTNPIVRQLVKSIVFSMLSVLIGLIMKEVKKRSQVDEGEAFTPSSAFKSLQQHANGTNKYKKIAQTCLQSFAQSTDKDSALSQIGGLKEVKGKLESSVLKALMHPQVFFDADAPELAPSRRVLLCGPPGTGKTMLARALALDARAEMMSITLGTIEDKYYGETPKILRAIFELTKERARVIPVVLFIDELDGIMRKRREDDQACVYGLKTEFLQMMDSITSTDKVVIIGCTNYASSLDDALLRRFSMRYELKAPTLEERREIIQLLTKNERRHTEKLCNLVAAATEGFTGSKLKDAYEHACANRMQRALKNVDLDASSTAKDVARKMPALTEKDWGIETLTSIVEEDLEGIDESPPP